MADKDREHVHLVVDADRKDEWESYWRDHPNYSSLSELIRDSVNKQISGEFEAGEEKYDEVVDELSNMRQQVARVDSQQKKLIEQNIDSGEMENMLSTIMNQMRELQQPDEGGENNG
jgi:SMC interacting uncharacterized protein involved in chromosome segregation